jgi:hypothetical protein
MPTPPGSAAVNLVVPTVDALGRRLTPNVDLTPDQALWQLRIGLNVAALSCRGPNETVLVGHYSTFLRANQRTIAAAERAVIAGLGRTSGTNGIALRDALSTRLYNYFAQPPVKTEFCVRATEIMAAAAVEPGPTIRDFAVREIARLDQPFVDFYAAYDRYRADLAVWRAQHPQPAMTPAAAPPAASPNAAHAAPAAPGPTGG